MAVAHSRFSPLLLDEEEFFVIECLATMDCPRLTHMESGTLYVCTRSLFFDPDDVTWPIVRIPFVASSALECNQALNTMTIATSSYAMMKVNGRDEPYTFVKEKRDVSVTFKLTYAHVVKDHIHTYTQQMVALSRLPRSDSLKFQEMFLEGIEEAHRFDVGMLLEPFTERVLVELDAIMLSQMAKERGKFVVGDRGVYFQPLNDVSGRGRAEAPCEMVRGVLRRQSAHMDIGLEIAFGDLRSGGSRRKSRQGAWLVVFRSGDDREAAFRSLSEVLAEAFRLSARPPVLDTLHHEQELSEVTRAWQRGVVSNFEYLMYCNVAANRSFNDLAQYPVFPWVLKDYMSDQLDLSDPDAYRDLSKPVGALNPTRLEAFRRRYLEMADGDDEAFLYGTHFSCPAYVLFWLVRRMAAHQLRLQGGKFDAPDRLFHGVSESFESVLNSTSDVKELIPEMYGTDASFLMNDRCLPLGRRQNGTPVGDVVLPAWAKGSADEFLRIHRAALESDHVSSSLHMWIDLIFGVHQRSLEKNNVFRSITYGSDGLGAAAGDAAERANRRLEIEEFGAFPRQIFFAEHPRRHPPKGAARRQGTVSTHTGTIPGIELMSLFTKSMSHC